MAKINASSQLQLFDDVAYVEHRLRLIVSVSLNAKAYNQENDPDTIHGSFYLV